MCVWEFRNKVFKILIIIIIAIGGAAQITANARAGNSYPCCPVVERGSGPLPASEGAREKRCGVSISLALGGPNLVGLFADTRRTF